MPKRPLKPRSGVVDPDLLYTLESLAAELGITPRALREKYINTGLLEVMPFARSYLIHGQAFINFALSQMEHVQTNSEES